MVSEFYILFISLNIVYFLFLFFDSILSINTLEELNLYRLGPSCIIIAYYIKSLVGEQYVVMPISIVHWRIEIEVFNLRSFMRVAKSLSSVNVSTILAKYLFMLLCGITLLLICGDTELNPGTKKTKSCYNFSLCHWNLNCITVHNFSKISLLEAYYVQHKFDMICISETYLDSNFPNDDPKHSLPGFTMWLEQIILTMLKEAVFVSTLRSRSLFVR